MDLFEDLQYRGLVYQFSDEEGLKERMKEGPISLYAGFDPTADSLHIGNLLVILTLKRFQDAGHTPIGLVGGGTGLVGDPSGRNEERTLNDQETVNAWSDKIKNQLEQFLDFKAKGNAAKVVNNYDWLGKVDLLTFLRAAGKHFSVNDLLSKDSVSSRLENGISYTEFTYSLLQAYDFAELYKNHDCVLQIGGSDQWGNIVAGTDYIRKALGERAYAFTFPLVTKADGTKFGKTAGGAVWLDAEKTSPYAFYQFWLNTADEDVINLIKYFTFLSHEEINRLTGEVAANPGDREAQKLLANEMTVMVHGKEALSQAMNVSEALFSGNVKSLSEEELAMAAQGIGSSEMIGPGLNIVDTLVHTEVVSSKRQAREDVEKGSIYINGERCEDLEKMFDDGEKLHGKYTLLRRGKKTYHMLIW